MHDQLVRRYYDSLPYSDKIRFPSETVAGNLVHADQHRLVLARETASTGRVHIHFPRTGYCIS